MKVFLKNFPNAQCKYQEPPSCASEAEGLVVRFDDEVLDANTLREPALEDQNQMLVVTFLAPMSQRAGVETGRVTLGSQELQFEVKYKMPHALVTPRDGSVSGGQVVTISAIGWWGNGESLHTNAVPSADEVTVEIGGNVLTRSSIMSVEKDDTALRVALITPRSLQVATVAGSIKADINSQQKTSRFSFHYYQDPSIVSVQPQKATLRGQTTSDDGQTILLTVKDFPRIDSAGDVRLAFDNLECGARASCGIVEIQASQQEGSRLTFLRIRVPTAHRPGEQTISLTQVNLSPGWQIKSVTTQFEFYQPPLTVRSARWCKDCNGERSCIVMGKCANGIAPLRNLIPTSGGGSVTIVVEHPPADFIFRQSTGSSDATISLALGEGNYGQWSRVANGDGTVDSDGDTVRDSTRVSFEFTIPPLFSTEEDHLQVSMQSPSALAPSTARLRFSMFDDSIIMTCHSEACASPESGDQDIFVALTNFLLSEDMPLTDQIFASFGELEATSIERAADSSICNGVETCLHLVSPACTGCVFTRGAKTLALAVGFKADPARGASLQIAYYSSPAALTAMMDTVGTSINVVFDQETNRGGMEPQDDDCSRVLDGTMLNKLGKEPRCVWEADDSLNIFLSAGATIAPSDMLEMKPNTIRSANLISGHATITQQVLPPQFAVAPVVSVIGSEEIDPCSELTLRATADSPRPLQFVWTCSNDATLNEALAVFTGDTLLLEEGTKEMEELDKAYEILVIATDFMGTSSEPFVHVVVKKAAPAPLLTFSPPSLSIFRDESALAKVIATFSKCPVDKGKLVFAWSLLSASEDSTVNAEVFDANGAQLLIPSNVLTAGSTYTLAVTAFMDSDSSKTSQGEFQIHVMRRPLQAVIRGGAGIAATTVRPLQLDASDSKVFLLQVYMYIHQYI